MVPTTTSKSPQPTGVPKYTAVWTAEDDNMSIREAVLPHLYGYGPGDPMLKVLNVTAEILAIEQREEKCLY